MKLTNEALKEIRSEARLRIGGFGMRIELGIKWNRADDNQDYFVNLLQNPTPESTDTSDFYDWKTVKGLDIPLISGFALLDFYVHDQEELKNNLDVLIDASGNVVKVWTTSANKEELKSILQKAENIKK